MGEKMPIDKTSVICENALELVGSTPLVHLPAISKGLGAKIAAKVEYFSVGCSVKDRPGSAMVLEAQRAGLITPGKTVLIEPTSGNMGVALAWTAAVLGYKLILVMPSSMSLERRTLLRAYGAEIVLTDPALTVKGSIDRAYELQKFIPDSVVLNQFSNENNIKSHYTSTGPEIWKQSGGNVDVVVFGIGSGGTMTGVGEYLRERKPGVKVYAAEPFESSVISGEPPAPHGIPGMGAGLVPANLHAVYDGVLRIRSADAIEMSKRLAREEGYLVGISAGANVCAAIELAKRPENKGKLIITTLCDGGERYLSTILYKDIKDEVEKLNFTTFDDDKTYLGKKYGYGVSTPGP